MPVIFFWTAATTDRRHRACGGAEIWGDQFVSEDYSRYFYIFLRYTVYRLSGSDVGLQAIHGSHKSQVALQLQLPCQAKESQKASNETEEWSQRTQEPQEDPGTDLSM